jgi:hypothetical protein
MPTNDYYFALFQNKMDVTFKISRCDPFPLIDPQGYAVGFTVYCNSNGRSTYRDVFVSFADMMKLPGFDLSDSSERSSILDAAYKKIQEQIKNWYRNVCTCPVLLGSVYTPPPEPLPALQRSNAMTEAEMNMMRELS